jgi:hypothetical protein
VPDLTAVSGAAARVAAVRVVVPRGALDVVADGADDVVGADVIFGVLSPLPSLSPPSPTTASVSCTGLIAAGEPAIGAAAAAAGDAAGVAFERVARYPPTPAATMHAVASAAKANRFDHILLISLELAG